MSVSEQFLRLAHECESIARSADDSEIGSVWRRLAERWVRCAELAERHAGGAMKLIGAGDICQIG